MIMKRIFFKITLISVLLQVQFNSVSSQNEPFYCDYNAYLFQYNDIYSIDLASGSSFLVATDVTEGNINAAAYNPTDGYMYGSLSTPEKSIVKIGKDFTATTYFINELPTTNRYIGDISSDGIYFLKGGGKTYYRLDLNPASTTYAQYLSTEELSVNINIHDWAFNSVDNMLYSVEKNTNILYRINPITSQVESLGVVPILSGLSYTYGAVYFDLSGRFYVSANQTGTIYVIQNVQDLDGNNNIESNLFAFGPSSSSNDGARCPTAPVPQEDCSNGIDDDGDGLVDCEDPSCSGYAECPVIEQPVSGGNEGGLESNNRLSKLINKRKYNRVKYNYKFDKKNAKRVKKTVNYKSNTKKSNIELQNFIPLEVINESEVIESSPKDLLKITNATEVYSADYLKDNKTVASILALKTENGVYEHTKYICDRLLGAELLAVSTIDINEQSFIKSIIKNTDGTIEFVLSLSAKLSNKNESFEIESHWNLDKYEEGRTYYNFQLWSNSIDDLFNLGSELLDLLNTKKPIINYNNSQPPTVFVKKGKYKDGYLDLQIVNTNATNFVNLNAGLRKTETDATKFVTSTLDLSENYITNLQFETGKLFDIGFRIGDGVSTPDDLFMSDGPWGIDDSKLNTNILNYEVTSNSNVFTKEEFPIERNVSLIANTKEYISVYRALTPRFKAVDLSDYENFKFTGTGKGDLLITFIKGGIKDWEHQYKTIIRLTENPKDFRIPFSEFKSLDGKPMVLDDLVTIIFTMQSETGELEKKEMNLENLSFSKENVLSIDNYNNIIIDLKAVPNPARDNVKLMYTSRNFESANLIIYNQLGKIVYKSSFKSELGENEILVELNGLISGIYFCKLIGNKSNYKIVKLIIH